MCKRGSVFQVSPERGMPPPSSPGVSAFHCFEGGFHLSAKNVDVALDSRFAVMASCHVRDGNASAVLSHISSVKLLQTTHLH